MKTSLYTLVWTLLCCQLAVPVLAQEEFCSGLDRIIVASYTKFDELPAAYSLQSVGVGKGEESTLFFTQWTRQLSFPSIAEAQQKYDELAARLDGCKIDGSAMERTEKNGAQAKDMGRERLGRWYLPGDNPYADTYIEMSITKAEAGFDLSFEVLNGDIKRKYTSKPVPRPRVARPTDEPEVADLCATVNKLLKSYSDFSDIKGKQKASGGDQTIYESSLKLMGSASNEVQTWTGGRPAEFVAVFTSTDAKAAAVSRYTALVRELSACKWYTGEMTGEEEDTDEGKQTTWTPTALTDQLRDKYQRLVVVAEYKLDVYDHYVVQLRVYYKSR